MQVRIHQAGVSAGDLRLIACPDALNEWVCLYGQGLMLDIELVHLLSSLQKLLFVLVPQLCELVNVPDWASFRRH